MANFIEKLFHLEKRELNRLGREADEVIALDEQMTALTDEQLAEKTAQFKKLVAEGATIESIKYEAFAVAREAAWRVLKQKPFKVQVVGALVLSFSDLAPLILDTSSHSLIQNLAGRYVNS